jgi:hypothetical protein
MPELDAITKTLRRHRKDLNAQFDDTSVRSTETTALLNKIEELRTRFEKTQRTFELQQNQSKENPRQSLLALTPSD